METRVSTTFTRSNLKDKNIENDDQTAFSAAKPVSVGENTRCSAILITQAKKGILKLHNHCRGEQRVQKTSTGIMKSEATALQSNANA